uniref:Diaminopimelate decarboxylase n=1 Tax=uncultured gamma proteobacterium EF100_93H11 TaxID=710976 RepID=E0Y1U1_9GAMM|nr:diaminopimelate decarboxylase [uncultured gamma proteobacterium EF100_93H11]
MALSGRPGGNCYFKVRTRLQSIINLIYHQHGQEHFVAYPTTEVPKVVDVNPPPRNVIVVVRLAIEHEGAIYELSSKFGADIGAAVELVRAADHIGYTTGLAFHVGSQCVDAQAYRLGLEMVSNVVQQTSVALNQHLYIVLSGDIERLSQRCHIHRF